MVKNHRIVNFALFEFTRRACSGGGISPNGFLMLPVYYLQIIPTLPFALLQLILFREKIRNTQVTKDPIFILGHYRSGTTLLQKLMASDNRFGFLNYYDALFPNTSMLMGKWMQSVLQAVIDFFKIRNPFFHDTVLPLSEADEEDDYLINKGSAYSAYWGLIFPKRWKEWLNGSQQFSNEEYLKGWKKEYMSAVKFITFRNKGKQLVLKNPPNTERIAYLLQMFPQAKFIFIYRNPYVLFYSIRNMWKRAILGFYSVQLISDEELDEIVFGHFEYLMGQYEKDRNLIPSGNLCEVSYEELKDDPFATIQKIYSQLNIPDFEKTAGDLRAQIESEKDYKNFRHIFDPRTIERIGERWAGYISRWNYDPPEVFAEKIS
ncbi:MAG TPA: sulfotransferase [Bacteroidales bacterium]|jgi:hypothetical protein|nr:sulfotransferase [Bacteroidales bacterium]